MTTHQNPTGLAGLACLAFALMISSPPLGAQDRAGAASRPEVGPQDWSWYPFEPRPDPVSGGFVGEGAADGDDPAVIHAGNARFRAGREPLIPAELKKPLRPGGRLAPGWFLVHFRDGVHREQKELVDLLCGPVRRPDGSALARWYAPHDTLGVWVDGEQTHAALRELPGVDWVGRYQPAWKLSPAIGRAPLSSPDRIGRTFFRLNLELVPGAAAEPIVDELHSMGVLVLDHVYVRGEQTYDVSFVAVDALPQDVTRIAHVEGVRTILEAADGRQLWDLSGGGKLQARTLTHDNKNFSPIVTAVNFPLWVTHNLQGQHQLIGVVDTALDWNNLGTSGCDFGYPDTNINRYGFAFPVKATMRISAPMGAGVNIKVPLVDLLGGATLQADYDAPPMDQEHGVGVAGAAVADFYGNKATKWWEHDVDDWESWSPTNFSGLLGPGIAHEAQLYFTPVDDDGAFAWNIVGEFETHLATTLSNMDMFGTCASVHSTGLAEAMNLYTMLSVAHDTAAFDHPQLLQVMAAGNCGEGSATAYCGGTVSEQLTSQAVVKNALTVGASDDVGAPEDRAAFSSAGPTFDNRRKPDLMTPGTDLGSGHVGSASQLILPDNNGGSKASCAYQYTSGTSFSAPIAAGAAALIHQYFEEGRYSGAQTITDPSAALMKAMLVNAGHRLTGANLFAGQYPDAYQGWGEPNLMDVLELPGEPGDLVAHDVGSASGHTRRDDPVHTYAVHVDGSGEPLRVSLAWTDEPGGAGGGKKLINNLQLRVIAPSGASYLGNAINKTTGLSWTNGGQDARNNLECAIVDSPGVGDWLIKVDPGGGNYSIGQGYGLVATGLLTELPDPEVWYFTFTGNVTVPGVGLVENEDIVRYEPATDTWSLYVDGSDVGLDGVNVNAIHVRPDGDVLLSFRNNVKSINGVTGGPSGQVVTDSDILLLELTTTGASTTGSLSFFFEGGDVGLSEGGEDIDGIYEYANGDLAISAIGKCSVPGVHLFRDEDIAVFSPTSLGATTAGSWSRLYDGSDIGLIENGEDLGGITLDGGVDLYFTTFGNVTTTSVSGKDEDVTYFRGEYGSTTDGFLSLELDLSALGIDGTADVDGLSMVR